MNENRGTTRGSRAMWIALALILAAGLALRIAWFGELKESPDFASPTADAAFHDYWARALATGDWSAPEGEADPRLRDVPYLRPPGYPYFLAAVYKIGGLSYAAPRYAQFALGLLNAFLLFLLASALFDRGAGLIAAALGATYWGFVYFEGQLQAPALIVTLLLLLLLALRRWDRKASPVAAVVPGLLLGLLALVAANALLLVPVLAVWIWRRTGSGAKPRKTSRKASLANAAVFVVAAAAAVAPATIRNAVVAGDPVLISCNGAINLYIGNNEESDGVTARIPRLQELTGTSGWSWFSYDRIVQGVWKEEGRQLSYSEVSGYFAKKALGYIASHPGRFLGLTLKRAALFWGPDEISNNKAIGVEKANSAALRFLPPFPVMASLSLAGAVLLLLDRRRGRKRRKGAKNRRPLDGTVTAAALVIVTWFASYLPFLAAGRFRLPVIPLLFLFAACAVRSAWSAAAEHRWGRLAPLPVAWVVLFFLMNVSLAGNEVDVAWYHTDRALAHMREGRFTDAEEEFRAALRANPGYVDARINYGLLLAMTDRYAEAIESYRNVAEHRPDRYDVRIMLASLLTSTGRREEAIDEMREVVRANPNLAEAYFELGRALIDRGSNDEGIAAIRRCLALDPDYGAAHANLAAALTAVGKREEAIDEYRIAVEDAPESAEIRYQFGNALLAVSDLAGAENAFRDAIRLNPEYVEPVIHLGMVFNREGRHEEAIRQFRTAISMDRRNMIARCNLGGSLANLGRYDEAIEALEEALTIEPDHALARERLEMVKRIKREKEGR